MRQKIRKNDIKSSRFVSLVDCILSTVNINYTNSFVKSHQISCSSDRKGGYGVKDEWIDGCTLFVQSNDTCCSTGMRQDKDLLEVSQFSSAALSTLQWTCFDLSPTLGSLSLPSFLFSLFPSPSLSLYLSLFIILFFFLRNLFIKRHLSRFLPFLFPFKHFLLTLSFLPLSIEFDSSWLPDTSGFVPKVHRTY